VIGWEDAGFTDRTKTEAEMRTESGTFVTPAGGASTCATRFRLFDLIDSSATGELESVAVADYCKVADPCTLCAGAS